VRERDDSRHLAFGAGAPADPEQGDGSAADELVRGVPSVPGDLRRRRELIEAVTDFLDDLVDDADD
jgi:hypothetical protein